MKKGTKPVQTAMIQATEGIDQQTGLTPVQEKAAILLASGINIGAVAEQLNLSKGTLYNWQRTLTFQCFYNRQSSDYRQSLRDGLFGLADTALSAIRDSLTSTNEAVRLRAAIWVVERVNEAPVGGTDFRAELRKECTYTDFGGWDGDTFHAKEYNDKLVELGINDPQ